MKSTISSKCRVHPSFWAGCAGALALVCAGPGQATPFARVNGTGTVYTTLQAAIAAAQPGNRVQCSANVGAYNETVVIGKNLMLDGGYDLTCTNKPGGYHTQINGTLTPGAPLITIFSQAFVHIRDFDLYNASNSGTPGSGGGLCITQACRVVVEGCAIAYNAADNGGGVFAFDGAIVVLSNCYVHDNTAAYGGGAYVLSSTGAFVGGCEFKNNTAYDCGGGVYVAYSLLTLTGGVVCSGNEADRGGGMYAWRSDVLAVGADISIGAVGPGDEPNTADEGAGIAIYDADVTLRDWVRVINNAARLNGGGLWMTNGTLSLYNNVLVGADAAGCTNYAGANGGGIWIVAAKLVVSNQTRILNNAAGGAGGGVYGVNARLLLRDCFVGTLATSFANRATLGGGVYALNCSSDFTTVELAGNEADQAGALDARGGGSCFINDSVIIGNRAQTFGGVRLDALTLRAILDQTDVISNSAAVANGGIFTATPLLVRNQSRIMCNEAPETAGLGVLATTATLDTVEISYNQATNGGAGIDVFDGRVDCRDVLIQYNNADRDGDGSGVGGGVRADNSAVVLRADARDGLLFGNSAGQGGGVYAAWGSSVRIEVASNRQYMVSGNGGLHGNGGGVGLMQSSTLSAYGNIVFSGNGAVNGGAACVMNGGTIELGSSNGVAPRLLNNYATRDGGALCAFGAGSTVRLDRAVLGSPGQGNTALQDFSQGGGGAVAVFDRALLDAVNVQLLNNVTRWHGGAVYSDNAQVRLRGDVSTPVTGFLPPCVIQNNLATNSPSGNSAVYMTGGAAYLRMENVVLCSNRASQTLALTVAYGATADLVNTVIAHNKGNSSSSSTIMAFQTGCVRLVQCTIAHNEMFGVNRSFGSGSLTNCIVWGHTGYEVEFSMRTCYSDIEGGFAGGGVGNIDADPLFASAAGLNYQLTAPSPCINTGIVMSGVINDCIGNPRPYGGGYDLGAYEFVPEPALTSVFVTIIFALFTTRRT